MFTHLKRILMAEADAATGAAAPVVAAAPAADVPQAQGASITMSKTEFDAAIASAADQAVAKAKDSIFAEARRTFTAQKPSKQKTEEATPGAADDPATLIALRDSFDDATAELKLTKGQRQILREAVMTKRPGDVDGFVTDYVSRAGWGSTPAAPVAAPAAPVAPKPTNALPASDRGSPAAAVPLIEADIVTMSESDRAALIKEKGAKWFTEQYKKQAKGRSIRIV